NWSFSKTFLAYSNNCSTKSLRERFPRANLFPHLYPVNNVCTDIVIFQTNLSSTTNFPRYNIILQHLVCLTPDLYGVVVGILLSDGWVSKANKNGQVRLFLKQSIGNSEYLFFTFLQLSHYCGAYPHIVRSKLNGKVFCGIEFVTRSLTCFTELYNDFYINKVKCVPTDIYNKLTIQGLAHWICGDGTNVKGGGIVLQTDNFTVIDVVRLISVLIYKFNCKCTIHYQRGNPVIYISRSSVKKLSNDLMKHMPRSMHYKITGSKHVK
uniref:LAGLIDADG homing endonuclease n=1 Tax=Cyathus striatus TaxID=68777 RepID=UPI0023F518B2